MKTFSSDSELHESGLAVAQGTWSSLIVVVSFVWGMLVFGERVKNVYLAGLGVMGLMTGLVGMSVYSAPEKKEPAAGQSNPDEAVVEGGLTDKSVLLTPDPLHSSGYQRVDDNASHTKPSVKSRFKVSSQRG